MFTNEQLDKLLTMYKENYLESEQTINTIYSTVLRGSEIISVKKELLKKGDKLVISDQDTLTNIGMVGSFVKDKSLMRYRVVFPDNFRERLMRSNVYLNGVGNMSDIAGLNRLLGSLRDSVKRLKYYNVVDLRSDLSDDYVRDMYGSNLTRLHLNVDNNRLESTKHNEVIDYIINNEYSFNFYKILTSDEFVLGLIKSGVQTDTNIRKKLMGVKGGYLKLNDVKSELVRCINRVNEFDVLLSNMVVESLRINNEGETRGVEKVVSDTEKYLQNLVELDMSKLSKGSHYAKFDQLSLGNFLNSKSESYYFEDRFNSKEHEVVKDLLNKIYRRNLLVENKISFDIGLYFNESMRNYRKLINQELGDKDYYGVLVGDSNDKLTYEEAKGMKDMVETLYELLIAVYEKEGNLDTQLK